MTTKKQIKAKAAKTRKQIFIKDSRYWWKLYSQQITLINGSMLLSYIALPDKLQDAIPPLAVIGLALSLLVLGFVARMVKQNHPPG